MVTRGSRSLQLVFGATLSWTPGIKTGGSTSALTDLLIVLIMFLLPLVFYRFRWRPGPPDADGGDGWRNDPDPRDPPPDGPRDGIPLDDAVPSHVRLRGHQRLAELLPTRQRRPVREPERAPVRETTPSQKVP